MGTIAQAVSQPRIKRRYRSAEERQRIVEETLVPGTSVAIVARAHGVNANQVFGWRKLYQAGLLGSTNAASVHPASPSSVRLLPVTVSADTECQPAQTAMAIGPPGQGDGEPVVSPGVIELTLAKAQVRNTAKKVIGGAGLGALIGGIAGGGKGAAIGLGAGAATGTAVSAATKGKQVAVPSESLLEFRLSYPVTLPVAR